MLMCRRTSACYISCVLGAFLCLAAFEVGHAQTPQERQESAIENGSLDRAASLIELVATHYENDPTRARAYGWEAQALLASTPESRSLPDLYF